MTKSEAEDGLCNRLELINCARPYVGWGTRGHDTQRERSSTVKVMQSRIEHFPRSLDVRLGSHVIYKVCITVQIGEQKDTMLDVVLK